MIFVSAFLVLCSYGAVSLQAIRPPDPLPHSQFLMDYQGPGHLCAKNPVVQLYSAPTTKSKAISQVLYGKVFDFIEETNNRWTKVKVQDVTPEVIGWVQDADIGLRSPIGWVFAGSIRTIRVNQKSAAVYPTKNTKIDPLIVLLYSTELAALKPDKKAPWIEVFLIDHSMAYVRSQDVVLDDLDN